MVEAACAGGSAPGIGDPLPDRAKVVKLMSLRDDANAMPGPQVAGMQSLFHDVLRLTEAYEATLSRFGSRTRRNIRHVRRAAATHGVSFALLPERSPVPHTEICGLAERTRPLAHPPSRIGRFEQFVDAAGGGFRSVLRAGTGRLVSYCRGFLHGGTAYLIYQLNDSDWHGLSPSLLHRSHLIEALTNMGVRELIFVHGCSGVLHRACDPMPVDQAWIMRPGLSAQLLTQAVAAVLPPDGYRHLARAALRRPMALPG